MNRKIRVAVDGAGGMGRLHAYTYINNPACDFVGFCSENDEIMEKVSAGSLPEINYGESLQKEATIPPPPKRWKAIESLASDESVDAVSICLPNALHYDHAEILLKGGKHLLIEKPMAINYEQCSKLIALAEKNNVLIQIAHMWRFHKEVQALKKIIHDELIGKIVQVKGFGIHERWSPEFFGPDTWFINKKLSGGGALIDMGVHAIDTINYLLDDPDCESVYARVRTVYSENIEVDDCAMIMCNYSDGVVGIIESAWNSPYAEGSESSVILFGTKGYARLFPTEIGYYKNKQWQVEALFSDIDSDLEIKRSHCYQIKSFIDSIRLGKKRTLVPGEIGAKAVKICDAAYMSEKTGQLVYLKKSYNKRDGK